VNMTGRVALLVAPVATAHPRSRGTDHVEDGSRRRTHASLSTRDRVRFDSAFADAVAAGRFRRLDGALALVGLGDCSH